MPDFLLRNIDEPLAVRIKDYARDRKLTLSDALLELLRAGLAVRASHAAAASTLSPDGQGEVRMLGGSWTSDEAGAFSEAIKALERLPR